MDMFFANNMINNLIVEAERSAQDEVQNIIKAPNKAQQVAKSSKALKKQIQKHPSFMDAMKAASIAATDAVSPAL